MAFRSANITAHLVKFNSAVSSDFLDMYENLLDEEIKAQNNGPKHRTFAPSQMRCDRVSWFRLRGTPPDKIKSPDRGLDFTAKIGTACHEIIQERLSAKLGSDWVSPEEWIAVNPEKFQDYDMSFRYKQHETLIDMKAPYPVRFACDGIIRFQNKIRLLEIKTIDFSALQDLIEPMPKHLDQIKCYATLLHIPDALFLYEDRQYGDMKCFEIHISENESDDLRARMTRIMELAEANIAPDGLPYGDPACGSNMCPYYAVCKQWGR